MRITDMIKQFVHPALCVILLGSSTSLLAQTCVDAIPSTTPDSQLVDNGDGTVTDSKTGLMWKQCSEGLSGSDCGTGTRSRYSAQSALNYVTNLNSADGFAGHKDWRVPNIKELNSILDHHCVAPALNTNRFPLGTQERSPYAEWRYITSTPRPQMQYYYFAVNIYDGRTSYMPAATYDFAPLRLVRSAR